MAIFVIQGCKKSFLYRPPVDSPTAGTFYGNDNEVMAGTGPLYNAVWFFYNGTPMESIGDVMGGNLLSDDYNGRLGYLKFAVPATDGNLLPAYQEFWRVIANSNVIMYNINNANTTASKTIRNMALAECRFMRAMAYYYLVLDFGPVPIIYDNISQISDTSIRRNNIADVWKFIIMDLAWARNNLPAAPYQQGRITKWSAEGMLAKAYLCRSGYGQSVGSRTQSDLDSAKYYAGDVCQNSGLNLLPNYADLFRSAYFNSTFNNQESLFGLQWIPNSGWGTINTLQSNLAYSTKITQTGDGWGGSYGASASLLAYYMDSTNKADSIRRKATFMFPNDFYPEISQKTGGWWVDTALFNRKYGNDRAYVKKYVIGSPADNGGKGGQQSVNINTYMLRLAEVYLIYAEAVLGNASSTSDANALQYFNAVRTRAGVPPKTSISFADIFQEKKVEFAFEGVAWYDWKRWYYFDPANAKQYFNTQNRGFYNIQYNGGRYLITYYKADNSTSGTVNYTITDNTVDLPVPESELVTSPSLNLAPVPFDFNKVSK